MHDWKNSWHGSTATPAMEGVEAVRIPGDIRAQFAEKFAREGIPVAQELQAPLL